jgi:hypothetical protein
MITKIEEKNNKEIKRRSDKRDTKTPQKRNTPDTKTHQAGLACTYASENKYSKKGNYCTAGIERRPRDLRRDTKRVKNERNTTEMKGVSSHAPGWTCVQAYFRNQRGPHGSPKYRN